jgi:CubicO group peptidase (beta-lactamase class C family)
VQGAIAREYGQPSWAALKQFISGQSEVESHALPHLEWAVARFAGAGVPGWTAPGEQELRQHFSAEVFNVLSAEELVAEIVSKAPDLRGALVVVDQAPLAVRAQIGDAELVAVAEESPPHRLTGIQGIPLGSLITDARVAAPPPARILGDAPAGAISIADDAFAELGPAALVIAGGDPGIPAWAVAEGWADLERAEILDTGHLFPAPGLAALVTDIAVLCLVADGRFALDTPANDHLRTVRLADDTITIRELLSHSSGIEEIPANPAELFRASVPDLVTITGPVIGCGGPRGVVRPVNSGLAVLGQLIADVTGLPYAAAVTRLVLRPLGMSRSAFPDRARHRARGGYRIQRDRGGHLRAGSGHGLRLAGRRRAVGDGAGPGSSRDRLVVSAARGARARGADPPGRAGARRRLRGPRLAHPPAWRHRAHVRGEP